MAKDEKIPGHHYETHDSPVQISQFKPMPTQGKFERVSDTQGVPYQGSKGTPNKNVG